MMYLEDGIVHLLMKPIAKKLTFVFVILLLYVPNVRSQQQNTQDSLGIPGIKKVRGGGRGDGTGGGKGDQAKKKYLPEVLIDSMSDISVKKEFTKDSLRINQLIAIADSYYNIQIDSAILFAKKAIDLSEAIEYKNGEINARYKLNEFYVLAERGKQGIVNGNALLELIAEEPDYNQSGIHASVAMFHQSLGNLVEAQNAWNLAIQSATDKQDTVNLIIAYIDAAIFYDEIDEYRKSLDMLDEGLKMAKLTGNYVAEHYILGNIGKVYANQGDFAKSVDYLNQSLRLKKLYYRPVSLAYGYYHLQQVFLAQGLFEESIRYGEEVQRVLEINPGTYLFKNSLIASQKASEALGRAIPIIDQSSTVDASSAHERLMQVRQIRALHNNEKTDEYIYFQNNEIGELEEKTSFQQKLIGVISSGLFLVFGAFYLIRSRAYAIKERKIQETFSQQLLTYQEEERKKISRDLHDSIGQSLILIKNKVQLKDEETGEMIASTLEEVRTISKQLHPVLLEKLGLTASIEKLVEEVDQGSEVFIEREITNIDGVLPKEQEVHLFRIIQETINNMLKHAEAVSASIKVEEGPNILRYSIQDRGKGFDLTQDASRFQSLGMQTLKERTKMLNGKLSIDSTVGKGTSIELIVPKPQHG